MHIRASTSGPRRAALGVATALTFSWFTAAQAQSCASDSVAPECLLQRSQDELQQADDELNRTYQKVLKSMSRPRDEYRQLSGTQGEICRGSAAMGPFSRYRVCRLVSDKRGRCGSES